MEAKHKKKQKIEKVIGEVQEQNKMIIIVLENAGLDYSRLGKQKQLLNCEDHGKFITERLKRDPEDFHPEIVHQCLLHLLDSPLNKSGHLTIFINTFKQQLIEVNPKMRVPRTYHRFSPLFAQLLRKQKIKSADSNDILSRVIRGPVTDHLPENSLKIALSIKGRLVKTAQYVKSIDNGQPIVFFIRASENQGEASQFAQDTINISRYRLTPCCTMTKLLIAFQAQWNII